jgi:hypothetical protein
MASNDPSREQRLAAALRDNLKRRKAQARTERPDDQLSQRGAGGDEPGAV